ncbi:hypothetical protein, partial [Paraburkholderia youngii]
FRCQQQVRALGMGIARGIDDPAGIAFDIADDEVELRDADDEWHGEGTEGDSVDYVIRLPARQGGALSPHALDNSVDKPWLAL